jgi:hypothetical protein
MLHINQKPSRQIYNVLEIKMIMHLCILNMRILKEEFGIIYKSSLTKLINRVDIEINEINYKEKNYNTNFFIQCQKKYPDHRICDISGMYAKEIDMILKSYPKDHFLQTWKFQ